MNASAPSLLVISNYSGAPNPIRPEAEIVLGLAKRGYKVWVMTPGASDYIQQLQASGCTIIDHQVKSKFDPASIRIIRRLIKEEGIQLIQAFYSKAIANAAWAVWSNRSVKLLSYRGYTGNIHWYDPSLYLSFLNPRIDKMVCLAESVRARYLANGVHPSRTITIHKGHSAQWYDHVIPANLEEFDIPAGAMVCSFVANHRTKMKGVRYLVEAVGALPPDKKVHVLMIGDGLETTEVKEWIRQQGASNPFTFTGFRSDASNIVKACDVSISLSLFGEATQKAMIEAMYLGNPVIMSDIIGNRGMLVDGEGGCLVPPADAKAVTQALVRLHDQPELRAKMGQASREHISTFLAVEKSIEEYDQLYRGLLD
jgi:glycosyltransferase involved in cell wall biosynthesis